MSHMHICTFNKIILIHSPPPPPPPPPRHPPPSQSGKTLQLVQHMLNHTKFSIHPHLRYSFSLVRLANTVRFIPNFFLLRPSSYSSTSSYDDTFANEEARDLIEILAPRARTPSERPDWRDCPGTCIRALVFEFSSTLRLHSSVDCPVISSGYDWNHWK